MAPEPDAAPPDLPERSVLDLSDYLAMFSALGHELRYRTLKALLADGEHSAAELQAALDVSSNTLHYHLSVLEDAGLVTNRKRTERGRDGVYSYYEVSPFGETLMAALGDLIREERRRLGVDVPGAEDAAGDEHPVERTTSEEAVDPSASTGHQ